MCRRGMAEYKCRYFVSSRLLSINSFENRSSDLSSDIAQITVFLKILHDQVFQLVQFLHFSNQFYITDIQMINKMLQAQINIAQQEYIDKEAYNAIIKRRCDYLNFIILCKQLTNYKFHFLSLQFFGGDRHTLFPLLTMDLIFQNSKELKEVRQFIKGLGYVYDSIDQKDKEVYIYISGSYVAIINNFIQTNVPSYRVCFSKLKRNMYKLKNFANGSRDIENDGIIFLLDVDLILKLLNTQVESDITQMTLTFPEPQTTGEKQYEMKLNYEADGLKGSFKLFTRLQHSSWPFKQGAISEDIIANSKLVKFLTFPSKFVKQIDYYKKFPQFWICLNPDGINLKRTEGNYVVSDQAIKKQEFGDYDFYTLNQALRQNINLNINSESFFHHLEQSNRQNRKTLAKILVEDFFYQQENMMKKCYLCLTTLTEKKQVHEFFQISARSAIDFSGVARQIQRLKLRTRDMKKQEQADDERIVLNRFYGPEYEETVRMDMIIRQGFVRQGEAKGEQTISNANIKRNKVQL